MYVHVVVEIHLSRILFKMGWVDLSGLKDKKKILSLLDKWPSLKKSFYNDYNGDFDNMIFSVANRSVMMYPKGTL